jgi:voltage-gated potassium channel Kch
MRQRIWLAGLVLCFLILFGTLLYQLIEGWSWVDALYFTTVTVTTVGYGDLVPTHDISKLVTVFYSFIGIGSFLYLLSTVGTDFMRYQEGKLLHNLAKQEPKNTEDSARKD